MLSRPPRIPALVFALLAPLSLACTPSTTTTTTTEDQEGLNPALIVRPREFMGDVPCSAAPGALRSYVATLIDHLQTEDPATGDIVEERFTFPSSLPTSCGQGVRFDDAVGGHVYSVEIEGYEAFADDIGPSGWVRSDGTVVYSKLRSGSRHMFDRTGAAVAPRWWATCGEGENEPTLAAASGTTLITGCDTLADLGEPGETAIEIDPADTLGAAACLGEGAPGQVEIASFDVQSLNGFFTKTGIACAESAPFTYSSSKLHPGQTVSFYVSAAREPGGPATLGAVCSTEVKAGLTVRAACAPLSDTGSVELDFGQVLAAYGYACGADFATYDATVTFGDESTTGKALACDVPKVFSYLHAGPYAVDAKVIAKDGKQLFAAHCEGEVQPGRTVLVSGCTQQ